MDGEKTNSINQWLHPYAPSLEPSHPGEEGKLINIYLGSTVPRPREIMHKHQLTNLGFRSASKRRPLYIAWIIYSVNHVYTTETLGKELGKEQKTLWNITMTEDFLASLTMEWHPLILKSSSINRMSLNNETSENLLPAPKNLGLGPDISQGPVVVISFAIISHILYRPVSHFLLL